MRKFTLKAALALSCIFGGSAMAQQVPSNWTAGEDVTTFKETTEKHSGENSVKVVVNSKEQYKCFLMTDKKIAKVAGQNIKISFWAKIVGDNIRATACINGKNTISLGSDFGYLEPTNKEWQKFEAETTIEEATTDFAISIRFYDITNQPFEPGEVAYVDDLVVEYPTGTPVFENTNFELWPELKPAPTAYPTEFKAVSANGVVDLSWVDAADTENYLIVGTNGTEQVIPTAALADDKDFSDGTFAMTVKAEMQTYRIADISGGDYTFFIYPYNNLGEDAAMLADASAPKSTVTVEDVKTILTQDFEDKTLGDWKQISVTGKNTWFANEYKGSKYAKMSGFVKKDKKAYANEDYLISPKLDLSKCESAVLTFDNGTSYEGGTLKLMISTDFDGTDVATATWSEIDFTHSTGNYAWVSSGEIDMKDYFKSSVYIAFQYKCEDGTSAATWQVDNILIKGKVKTSVASIKTLDLDIYPNPCKGNLTVKVADNNVQLNVVDLTGSVVYNTVLNQGRNNVALENLAKGLYFVKISSDKGQAVKKIILK
ncbi:MAG: choice-of-anchor J domain-containing protein [Hyphomicrobiales bacterium]